MVVAEASESFGSRRFASPPGFAPPSTATARYEPSGLHAVAETLHFLAITRDWATVASRSIEVSESAWDARSAAPEDAVAGCQFNPDSSAPDSPPFFSSLSATSHPPSSANAKRRVVFATRACRKRGLRRGDHGQIPERSPVRREPIREGLSKRGYPELKPDVVDADAAIRRLVTTGRVTTLGVDAVDVHARLRERASAA